MNYGFFADRSVHIAVVDPSVGSDRRPILVAADRHYFIGPDNGIFSYIYSAAREFLQVIHITDDHYFLKPKSPTFQGRDIFAPVAAWVAGGKDILNFGSVISDYVNMPLPVPEVSGAKIRGEIIAIDRFGNAMSNIRESDLERLVADKPERLTKVLLHGVDVPMKEFYAEASDKALCAVMNSSGYLEFFVNRGSASSAFSISIGDRVEITLSA
jgi:S-adenosylmethionine hydrolase